MFFVYVLECAEGRLYCGYTVDVSARIKKHESGKGAKYTRGRGPFKLLKTWEFETSGAALQAERRFKKLTRAQKLALLESDEAP